MRSATYRVTQIFEPGPPSTPLVLPWSAIVSDNDRFIVVYGENRLSPKYRRAKSAISKLAAAHWRCPLITGDVYLLARFWFPDLRKRDAGNYRKATTDALSGVIYADDKQIVDERYVRVGLDRERPRCEVWLSGSPITLENAA